MRSPRMLGLAVIAALGLALGGCAVTPPSLPVADFERTPPPPDPRLAASDAAIAQLVDPGLPGCSAAVGIRGEVVWADAVGHADLAGTPLTTSTRFDMASTSKQFTATAILLLAREGALALTDPVGAYVDGLPWGGEVNLAQLMHHTSRVPDYWTVLDDEGIGFSDPADHAHILDAIRQLDLDDDLAPGTYSYSNSNYVLLAEVVNRVSGMPLPQFLADRIFGPLDLDMELSPALLAPDVALSINDDLTPQPHAWTAYGAIGIYSTPSELARWGDQYRESPLGIIQDDYDDDPADEGTGEFYGAGLDLEPDGDLNHDGRFGGHITSFTVSADRQTTVVVMCGWHLAPRYELADALWAIWVTAPDATVPEGEG